jgi:hypothetical protein
MCRRRRLPDDVAMTGSHANHNAPRVTPTQRESSVGLVHVAGLASIAAGVIHASAVGAHTGHATLSRLFLAVAVAQIASGLLTVMRGGRFVGSLTVLVNSVAVAAWGVTKTSGIMWIDGLEQIEAPQFTDTACAALGAIAALTSLLTLVHRRATVTSVRLGAPAAAVGGLAIAALMLGTNHAHGDDGHRHGDQVAAHHFHGDESADATTAADQGRGFTAYDPTRPIDLSGVHGVTPEQQAFAENVVAENVRRLPQWADPAKAEAAGYHSIGDAVTGHEHYVNWDLIDDHVWLDPDHPESLVYEPQPDGSKTLVSAMYMLPSSITLADVPGWGGRLMQWHIHNDICLTRDPVAPTVAGLTDADGNCPANLQKLPQWPMIHVWITPHPCGPFGALEGIAAGQVREGEEHFCDHLHGQP